MHILIDIAFCIAFLIGLILALPSLLASFERDLPQFCVHCGARVVSRSHKDCWRCCRRWSGPPEEVAMGISGRVEPDWRAEGPDTPDGDLLWRDPRVPS